MTSAKLSNPPLALAAPLPSAGWWWLALYFGAQLLGRLLVAPALELDEAEQALWSQQLRLGYGTQPPLYTWLQWGVFALFGPSILSLALLKNLLLASTYACVFLAGRLLMPVHWAALAAASMLLLPQIGWESSRDLTHSVLLTALAAATLYQTLALLERPRPARYLLLGVTVGLGFLSKYSYGVFLVALLVAVLAGRDTRAVLASRWTLAAVALALAVVAPHGLWLLEHWHLATQATMGKLAPESAPGRAADIARGLLSLALAIAGFLWPWALAMGLVWGRALRAAWNPRAAAAGRSWNPAALWGRYLVVLAALLLAMVLVAGATQFKDRWMQPLLFGVPLMVFSCVPQLAQHPRVAGLRRLLCGLAVLVLVLLILRPHYHAWRATPNDLNLPTPALALALRQGGYAGAGTIVTADRALGGSLRLQFPQAQVVLADGAAAVPGAVRPVLRIDNLSRPERLAPSALQQPAPASSPVHELALPYRHARAAATPARFRYQLLR